MAKIHKLSKNGQTIYPATTTDAVAHPTLKVSASKLIGEINVSNLYPTGGTDGTNKYTLETAIAKIPSSLRNVGLKCSFLSDAGTVEEWVYQGGTFTSTNSWMQGGSGSGGNLILEWNTDAATTRKQVPSKERKAGMQISYKPDGEDWVNEQYVSTSFTDVMWGSDNNWEKIPNQKQIAKLDSKSIINCIAKMDVVPTNDYGQNGDYVMFTGNGYGRIYKKENDSWNNKAISLSNIYRVGEDYYIKVDTLGTSAFKKIIESDIEKEQSDNFENKSEEKSFVKNRNFSWSKGSLTKMNSASVINEKWMYHEDYASSTHNISSENITTEKDNMYLSFVAKIYAEGEEKIAIQVYDNTLKKYIYNELITINTSVQSFPVTIKMTQGNTYIIYFGKKSCAYKYYIAHPFTVSISEVPGFIHFNHDVDTEIDNLYDGLNTVNEGLRKLNSAFTEEVRYGLKVEEYTTDITTVFGKILLSDLDDDIYSINVKSNDTFRFAIYGFGISLQKIVFDIPDGTSYVDGYTQENVIDVKSLKDEGFDSLQFRTFKSGVTLNYSLFYIKKIANIDSGSIWANAIIGMFGNSIIAQNNGDFEGYFPKGWGGVFATNLKLAKLYGRGVGGQTYKWNDGAYYCKAGSTGEYINRYKVKDGTIDTSAGMVSVSTTQVEKQAIEAVLGYEIEIHRGCFCSWDRITSMFPESIKDTISSVCIMGGTNDFSGVEEIESSGADGSLKPLWSAENQTDTDWINAEGYYNGGDYDVTNTWGGMASCLMKMQVWMPQAKIIVLVPITRKGADFNVPVNSSGATHQDLCNSVKSVADWCNVEVVDMNCCGITQFNADSMLTDGVHPSAEGQRRMGKYLASKFNSIAKYY